MILAGVARLALGPQFAVLIAFIGYDDSTMALVKIDHVQLAMPAAKEDRAREFYRDLLGMTELAKPQELAKRGGCWFAAGEVQIHLGVEKDFRPAKKAHPALRCGDYEALLERLRQAGIEVLADESNPGTIRAYVHDPFGNRIELIQEPSPRTDPHKPTLVLASASPRRQELLRNAGIGFVVQAANIAEEPAAHESARDCAERLAREKAEAVAALRSSDLVLGADTVVFVDGEILGKPGDADDAFRMLRMLAGKTHQVVTGVCLAGPGFKDVRSETTAVTMTAIADEQIRAYIATGEPMDKAGAYAIQGIASRWISRIEGDYGNVVGLPVALVFGMLQERGVKL